MRLNTTNAVNADEITASRFSIDPGATLNVVNVGPDLVGGNFQLFNHPVNFAEANIVLPVVASPLFVTNKLAIDGSIAVINPNLATNPTNITATVSGNTLDLTWPSDHTGWRLQAQTNPVTIGISTNWADVAGSTLTNQVFMTMDPTNGTVFFRLIYP
jgi:hypothetical protein